MQHACHAKAYAQSTRQSRIGPLEHRPSTSSHTMAPAHRINMVKCRGKPVGYRAYIGGKYHSYQKTKALAKAAIQKALMVADGLGSTPLPKTNAQARAKGLKHKGNGLGSTPRPRSGAQAKAKVKAKTGTGLGSTPRPNAILFKGLVARFSTQADR